MFLRFKDIVVNTEQITSIRVYEDAKNYQTGKLKNYINVYFSGEDKETIEFDSKEELHEFLEYLQIQNI